MSHTITVLLETMPAHLRDSHRTCGNWGEWPQNGAIRARLPLEEAAELAAADDEYDHLVSGSEMIWFDRATNVDDQVATLLSFSLEHDLVSTLRSPALADALQRVCAGWRSDGRIWGGDAEHGYWLVRLIDPSTSNAVVEDLIEAARNEQLDDPPITERAPEEHPTDWDLVMSVGCGNPPLPRMIEDCPTTLRDSTVPSQVEASERDARALAEQLISSALRTGMPSRCEHQPAVDLMLRGLASEWVIGVDVITYQGTRAGSRWCVQLTGICPF